MYHKHGRTLRASLRRVAEEGRTEESSWDKKKTEFFELPPDGEDPTAPTGEERRFAKYRRGKLQYQPNLPAKRVETYHMDAPEGITTEDAFDTVDWEKSTDQPEESASNAPEHGKWMHAMKEGLKNNPKFAAGLCAGLLGVAAASRFTPGRDMTARKKRSRRRRSKKS